MSPLRPSFHAPAAPSAGAEGPAPISIATYNIHKGFSQFNRRMMVHELREELRALAPDILFLQEVQGEHRHHEVRHADWPAAPQHEFLAEDVWHEAAYGRNVVYEHGHHGNAVLSRFPIVKTQNQDVTHHHFERRGLLHCLIAVPAWERPLHCVCVHLSLFGHSRRRQLDLLARRLEELVPRDAPLIIAGDFNDWSNRANGLLAERLGLHEAFAAGGGKPTRSFPAALPLFRLDRIYVRGFQVAEARVHAGRPWSRISDHALLSARLQPNG